MRLKLLVVLFIAIALIVGLKIYIDCDIENFSKVFAYNIAHYNPSANKFNLYFNELASLTMIAVPYHFISGRRYEQEQVDANFEVIVNALKKTK